MTRRSALPVAAAMALCLVAPLQAATPAGPAGVWRNDRDSVRIRVAPCGGGLCGTVIAASEKARADAAAGGTERLIGTQLFRDFHREGEGLWRGTVFVPDLGQAFDGELTLEGANTLVGTGCIMPGLCRSQRWSRVAAR